MYGAILGDMIGSPFEFDRGNKTKEFPLFCKKSRFTDDTVMTVAVADALLRVSPAAPDGIIRDELIDSMHRWGRKCFTDGFSPACVPPTAASATGPPCGSHPLAGCTAIFKRPEGWRA